MEQTANKEFQTLVDGFELDPERLLNTPRISADFGQVSSNGDQAVIIFGQRFDSIGIDSKQVDPEVVVMMTRSMAKNLRDTLTKMLDAALPVSE